MNMEEKTILQDLLFSMREYSGKIGELQNTVAVLANELKNHTCRLNDEHKELKERVRTNELNHLELKTYCSKVSNRVDKIESITSSEKTLIKAVLGWIQWLIVLAVAIIQVFKGV